MNKPDNMAKSKTQRPITAVIVNKPDNMAKSKKDC